MMKRNLFVVVPVVAVLLLGACSSSGGGDAKTAEPGTVYTAEGLKDIVPTLVDLYKKAHPDANLPVVTAPMAGLSRTVLGNLPGVIVLPTVWLPGAAGPRSSAVGRNLLVIIVRRGNPRNIDNLAEYLSTPNLRKVGCGLFTKPDCLTTVPQDVAAGRLDAALMFRSGLQVPAGVDVVALPRAGNLVIEISEVVNGTDPDAVGFGKFLQSVTAKDLLTKAGLLP